MLLSSTNCFLNSSVYCSSSCHTWDAFQLAHASYMLYCALPDNSETVSGKVVPHILGDPPKIDVPPPELGGEEEEEGSSEALPAIKIYDDDVTMRFLVCGMPRSLVREIDSILLFPFFTIYYFDCEFIASV